MPKQQKLNTIKDAAGLLDEALHAAMVSLNQGHPDNALAYIERCRELCALIREAEGSDKARLPEFVGGPSSAKIRRLG